MRRISLDNTISLNTRHKPNTLNLSDTIKLLLKRQQAAEREGLTAEVEKLEKDILQKRRELLKLYRELKLKDDARTRLKIVDQSISELIRKTNLLDKDQKISREKLQSTESEIFLASVVGPNYDESIRVYKNLLAARSVSTYPSMDGVRAGDPICDYYFIRVFAQATIFSLADGCNWGEAPKQAAQRSSSCFVHYLQDRLHLLTDTKRAARILLKAIGAAHNAVLEGYTASNLLSAGTSTLLGGVLVPLAESVTRASVTKESKSSQNTPRIGNSDPDSAEPRVAFSAPPVSGAFLMGDDPNLDWEDLLLISNAGIINSKPASLDRSSSFYAISPSIRIDPKKHIKRRMRRQKESCPQIQGNADGKSSQRRWALVVTSVGDCKAFVYSAKHRSCVDVTSVNRAGSLHAGDCGGRLGAYSRDGLPDLRNLFVTNYTVFEGDMLILVSDGVHDNLDPQLIGKSPLKIDSSVGATSWDDLPPDASERIKTLYREKKLARLIHKSQNTPASICQTVINYCETLTRPSREFHENNPSQVLPQDYSTYPGKLDHTTCVCIQVSPPQTEFSLQMLKSLLVQQAST